MDIVKYAVILTPDGGNRYLKRHRLLNRLPDRWTNLIMRHANPYIICQITDSAHSDVLGYVYDLPGFQNQENLSPKRRLRHIEALIRQLNEVDINIIAFPFYRDFFYEDEIQMLKDNDFIILDGNKMRIAAMTASFTRIIKMVKKEKLARMGGAIWGCDNDIGYAWLNLLAPYFNDLIIGGQDINILRKFGDNILAKTGLSCQITDDMNVCSDKRDLIIIADDIKADDIKSKIIFKSYPLSYIKDIENYNSKSSHITVLSGYIDMPEDVHIDTELNTWDKLAVIDGLFYIMSRSYREAVGDPIVGPNDIEIILKLLDIYPLEIKGCIINGDIVSFDRFRMKYLEHFS